MAYADPQGFLVSVSTYFLDMSEPGAHKRLPALDGVPSWSVDPILWTVGSRKRLCPSYTGFLGAEGHKNGCVGKVQLNLPIDLRANLRVIDLLSQRWILRCVRNSSQKPSIAIAHPRGVMNLLILHGRLQ